MIPSTRSSAAMVQNLVPAGSRPLRAGRDPLSAESQRGADEDEAQHRLFRIQRESEVPRLLAAMGEGETAADGRRPDALANERQEHRQVVAVARVVCQATAETLLGLRPVSQLRRWLDAEVYRKIQQRAAIMARHRQGLTVHPRPLIFRSERACQPSPGCWEIAVVFSDELRTRACAMRLQAHRGRWRVVAMELG